MRVAPIMLLTAFLLSGCDSSPAAAQDSQEKAQLAARLPAKIQEIQLELPAWLQKTGNKEALALMKKLGEQVEAKQFQEAETTADTLLKMMGVKLASGGGNPRKPGPGSPEETARRLTAKMERVQEKAQKWAASGKDPTEVLKTMQKKFEPLMQAGRVEEAEAVLDSVLRQFGIDMNVPTSVPGSESSAEERVLTRIHLIQKERAAWIEKTGRQSELDPLMQKLKQQLADMNFAEAENTADAILELMGLSIAPPAHAEQPARPVGTNSSQQAADPLAAFIPQQLVFLASARIALTPEQRDTLLAKVNTTQPRLEELKTSLERESAALTDLTSQERVEEAAVLAQLNKFLDVERESKQLQASLGVTIQNLLRPEQQTKLREIINASGGVAKLQEEFKSRIDAKIAQVTAGAQELAKSGRDPSFISQAMEQNVRPLMDSGRVFEAEAEIDRVLAQLDKDAE